MLERTPQSSEAHTLPDHTPDGPDHPHPDSAPPLPDTGVLLAAVGLPSHAIREIVGNPAGVGADV